MVQKCVPLSTNSPYTTITNIPTTQILNNCFLTDENIIWRQKQTFILWRQNPMELKVRARDIDDSKQKARYVYITF